MSKPLWHVAVQPAGWNSATWDVLEYVKNNSTTLFGLPEAPGIILMTWSCNLASEFFCRRSHASHDRSWVPGEAFPRVCREGILLCKFPQVTVGQSCNGSMHHVDSTAGVALLGVLQHLIARGSHCNSRTKQQFFCHACSNHSL